MWRFLFCLSIHCWCKNSNSNTEWSWKHNLYQTVIEKVSSNNPFVKSNLLRYKSHNTILIPKHFIRNNVQQGECLTQSLHMWTWPSTQITLYERTRQSAWLDAVTTPLIRSEWILVYQTNTFWMDLSTKNVAKKNRKCSLRRNTCQVFKIWMLTPQKKKPCSARFFKTALRAVLINELIRINSGPTILRSCFLHWSTWYQCNAAFKFLSGFPGWRILFLSFTPSSFNLDTCRPSWWPLRSNFSFFISFLGFEYPT